MDPKERLPPELTVKSVEDILYRIGLSFDRDTDVTDVSTKRKLIHKPWIVLSFALYLMVTKLITLFASEDNRNLFLMLGDIGYLMGARHHLDMFIIMCSALTLSSQMIYYYNLKNGIKPTFLRVFTMMSGSVPPKRMGFSSYQEIDKLVNFTRIANKILPIHNDYFLISIGSVFCFGIYFSKCTLFEALVYGIPNTIIVVIWGNQFWNVFLTQFLVFYIICWYLKLKVNALNESLLEMKRRKRFIRIRETLRSLDSLYSEINEYNTTFWSKILLVYWLTFSLLESLILFIAVFGSVNFILKQFIVYLFIAISIIFLLLIFTASSVNTSVNKSYKILNSLSISHSQHYQRYRDLITKFKLSTFIGGVGQKRVGFSCWKLFTINYFRCYEVIALVSMLFLKIVEIKA